MVNYKSYHGLFFDAKILFYFFGYPWAYDTLHNIMLFKYFILKLKGKDLVFILRKTHIDFFVFTQYIFL